MQLDRWERKAEFQGQKYTAITTNFRGVGELADFTASVPDRLLYGAQYGSFQSNLYGQQTRVAQEMLRKGNEGAVKEAERLLRSYETAGLLAPMTPIMRPSIVGFMPMVPAVIAGQPETMFARDNSEAMSERSPVNIMIDCGVMAAVRMNGTEIMSQRGIALLTLVMALQTVRPVTLRLFDTMSFDGVKDKYVMWAVEVPTNPLHLAQLAYCLTSEGMACHLPFTHTNEVLQKPVGSYGFAWRLSPSQPEYERQCRLHWGLEDTDLCFTGGALEQGIGTDPMAWVQKQVDKLKQRKW